MIFDSALLSQIFLSSLLHLDSAEPKIVQSISFGFRIINQVEFDLIVQEAADTTDAQTQVRAA